MRKALRRAVALAARDPMLAYGDRRDCFVVVDPAGGHHALNKKLTVPRGNQAAAVQPRRPTSSRASSSRPICA